MISYEFDKKCSLRRFIVIAAIGFAVGFVIALYGVRVESTFVWIILLGKGKAVTWISVFGLSVMEWETRDPPPEIEWWAAGIRIVVAFVVAAVAAILFRRSIISYGLTTPQPPSTDSTRD